MRIENKMKLVTYGIIISVISVVLASVFLYNPYPGEYWYSAPDGTYSVFVSSDIEDQQIYFPLSESSGGDLHGYWKVASNVTVPDSVTRMEGEYGEHVFGYAKATLQNNIITNLEDPQ